MNSQIKTSFITTVFNEEKSIEKFLISLFSQSKLPDEIIVVDGGSTDTTVKKIKEESLRYKREIALFIKKGNRSVGRNEAIKQATGDVIVCSDAGNILDKDWIKNITEPFAKSTTEVVAGYYQGLAKNVFQKCVIPYALVMPDKIDPNNFLPATRSIAFRKTIWSKVGGFDEGFSHNEDYVFAKTLKKIHAKILFKKDAIVYWKPRNTFRQAFVMMYRFAYGDAEARIFRPKVVLLFTRYLLGILLIVSAIIIKSAVLLIVLIVFFLFYLIWAVKKNYKYVNEWQAFYLLPLLQLTADWAVLKGTVLGLFGKTIRYN